MAMGSFVTAVVGVLLIQLPLLFGQDNAKYSVSNLKVHVNQDESDTSGHGNQSIFYDVSAYKLSDFPCKAPGNSKPLGEICPRMFKGYKLALPIACGGKKCNIKGNKLEKYEDDHFYYDTDRKIAVFCTPAEGKTSKNSENTRTEIQEQPSGGDWRMSKDRRHTLEAHATVQQIAGDKVTIGQIHGDSDMPTEENEMLKIQVVGGKLRAAVKKNGRAQHIDFGSYRIGSDIHYKAVLVGTELTININGEAEVLDYNFLSSKALNGRWTLKFGNYCDKPEGSRKGDGCLVEFSYFSTYHEVLREGDWRPDPEWYHQQEGCNLGGADAAFVISGTDKKNYPLISLTLGLVIAAVAALALGA